jgi:hypothetical protein
MIVECFQVKDYFNMERGVNAGFEFWTQNDLHPFLKAIELSKKARTIKTEEGEVIAVYGLNEAIDGVGDVFFVPSKRWQKYKKSVCKFIRKDLYDFKRFYRRIQMICLFSREHLRFMTFFGFTIDGTLRDFDPLGREYVISSITGD